MSFTRQMISGFESEQLKLPSLYFYLTHQYTPTSTHPVDPFPPLPTGTSDRNLFQEGKDVYLYRRHFDDHFSVSSCYYCGILESSTLHEKHKQTSVNKFVIGLI